MIGRPVFCSTFIGRADELDVLETARLAASRRRGACVVIEGEPGIGKSRLLRQFVSYKSGSRRARNVGHAVCLEFLQRPFGIFCDFFETLATFASESDRTKLAITQLLRSDVDENRRLEKGQLFAGVTDYILELASKRATILAIDDLQWADPSSLELLGYLAKKIEDARVLLVMTLRSDARTSDSALGNILSRIERTRNVYHIELEGMNERDMGAVIDGSLEGHELLTNGFKETIKQRADGNPFFAEELLKHALSAPGKKRALPSSIRNTIDARLAASSASDREIIRDAAILGHHFDAIALARVGGRSVGDVLAALARGLESNVFLEDRLSGRFAFRHALTRECITERVSVAEAKRTHLRVVAALELDAKSALAELAYHAAQSGDRAKTLAYNERAGRASLDACAFEEAEVCFARALTAVDFEFDRARLLDLIGTSMSRRGALDRAIDAREQAFEMYVRGDHFDEAAECLVDLAADRSNNGDHFSVIGRIEEFLERFDGRVSAGNADFVRAFAAKQAFALDDVGAGRRLLAQLTAPDALPVNHRTNYLLARANDLYLRGDVSGWRACVRDAWNVIDKTSPKRACFLAASLAFYGIDLGANAEVERALSLATRLTEQGVFPGIVDFVTVLRMRYAWMRGRVADARELLDTISDRDLPVIATNLAQYGSAVLFDRGADDDVFRYFSDAKLDDMRHGAITDADIATLAYYARARALLGERDRAREIVEFAVGQLVEARPSNVMAMIVLADVSEDDQLQRLVGLARSATTSAPTRAAAEYIDAVAAKCRGEDERSRQHADAAAAMFGVLGWAVLEGKALDLGGRSEEARRRFHRGGALRYLRDERVDHEVLEKNVSGITLPLSRREEEIARLVSESATNVQIAERLSLSHKTVERHMTSIYAKLAVRSRIEIAIRVRESVSNVS